MTTKEEEVIVTFSTYHHTPLVFPKTLEEYRKKLVENPHWIKSKEAFAFRLWFRLRPLTEGIVSEDKVRTWVGLCVDLDELSVPWGDHAN